VPITKVKGSAKSVDLRPINILPVIEKLTDSQSVVFETMMITNEQEILTEWQSSFREKHSTETALQLVLENWMRAKDTREREGVFLDYRSAFETADRKLKLKKLTKMYNINGTLYE